MVSALLVRTVRAMSGVGQHHPRRVRKYSHNYMHHTYTNVVGKDRDVGYGILRMSKEQRWHPYYLGNPLWNALLAVFFQWGVAQHDIEIEKIVAGEKDRRTVWSQLKRIGRKMRSQFTKDYLVFPALAGPFFAPVLLGNATANLVRNLWSHAIIFCGHFPSAPRTSTAARCSTYSAAT